VSSSGPPIATFGTGKAFLLQKVKLALNGERFSDISDIQSGVTELLKGISLQDFHYACRSGISSVVWCWGGIVLNVCNENFEIHSFVFFFVKMLSRYLPATQ
jgi:hypothetical protein